MGYKFQDKCYETKFDMHFAFANECQASGSAALGSLYLSCTADPAGHVIMQSYTVSNGNPGTAWNYYPQEVTCTYEPPKVFSNADVVELSWLVVGVWVTAWGIKKLIETLKLR
jgi:hypothetical protein